MLYEASTEQITVDAALDSKMREYASHTQTLNESEKSELEAYASAHWGFLKNIINIDAFFSTGKPNEHGKKYHDFSKDKKDLSAFKEAKDTK